MDRGTVAKKSRKRRNSNTDNTHQQEKVLVFFSNDTILEVVKFLNYEKWSQMRFLCHRVNQLIQSNQSKLQAFEVKSLSMIEESWFSSNSIVSFDETIEPADAVRKWFQDRGYSCDKTANMPLKKVFAGMNLSGWNELHFTIRAFYEDFTDKRPFTRSQAKRMGKLPKMDRRLSNGVRSRSRPPELFSAKFNTEYEFCGPILSHFFQLLRHPATYFRKVSMFQQIFDKFCDMSSHNTIRCDQFTLHHLDSSLQNSLKWLKDNVRAQNITLAFMYIDKIPYHDLHSLVQEFLLLDASVCARDHINLSWLRHPGEFVKSFIKKYETLEVTKAIPSILIEGCVDKVHEYFHSNLVRQNDPILINKHCGVCDVKSYEIRNEMDGTRKMIVQFGDCFEHCCSYNTFTVYMSFE